jgi:ABC-2 type transport system permease protein
MPIAELGYRHWTGKRTSPLGRCAAIARSEVSIAFESSRLLRRFILLAWVPILYFCPIFVAFGVITDPARGLDEGSLLQGAARQFFSAEALERLRANPELSLPAIWSVVFFVFFAYTQALFSMIAVAIVAPPLISKDLRSKAFLVYLSKPIQPWQYLLGKLGTVVSFVFAMTLLPACFLYLVGIALSPNASTLLATLPIVLDIALCSLVIALPVGLVVLLLSSLTKDRKVATFMWIALWICGEFAFRVISSATTFNESPRGTPWAGLLSLRELTTRASAGIFDMSGNLQLLMTMIGGSDGGGKNVLDAFSHEIRPSEIAFDAATGERLLQSYPPVISMLVLAAVCILSAVILLRRIRRQVTI